MPITVPQSSNIQTGGIPSQSLPQFSPNAPAEAFGGGSAEQSINQSFGKIGNVVEDYAAVQARKANEMAMTGLDLEASKQQTRIELAAKQMRGGNAVGAMDYADSEWQKVQDNLKDKAANNAQVQGLSKILGMRSMDINRVVQGHMASEQMKFDQDQSETYNQAQADEAINNYQDPGRVAQARYLQNDNIQRMGDRLGWSPEMIAQKQKDTGSLTNTSVVMRMLDNGDYKSAQSFYDQNRGGFDSKDILSVEKNLEEGKVKAMGISAWGQVQGMKLADGRPDEAAMEKAVMEMPNATDSEKEKMITFVKTKAADTRLRKAESDRANDTAFNDAITNARKNNISFEAALPMARKFATGSYDQAIKEAAIQRMYAPPSESDISTKYGLWEGIQNGTVDKGAIDNALRQGKINGKDWNSLNEENYKATIEGRSAEMKRINDNIKILANTTFSKDSDSQKQFINVVNDKAVGKSPDDKWRIAQDELKTDPATQTDLGWFGKFGGDYQYQTDLKKKENDSTIIGNLSKDIGSEAMAALRAGAVKSRQDFSPIYLDQFQQAFGGMENIKPGTPAHNAILSLDSIGKIVNADTVKQALQNVPDGKFGNYAVPNGQSQKVKIPYLPRGRH